MSHSISPPPIKRRKVSHEPNLLANSNAHPTHSPPAPQSNIIRLYSWNINGIAPFLQQPITEFFKSRQTSRTKPNPKSPIPAASLRAFLHRHNWPEILFLQEVEIADKDKNTQDTVKKVVNTYLTSENGSSATKGPKYDVHFTLPTDKHNARGLGGSGKVYGVCSIVRTDISTTHDVTTNIRTVDWDNEGRVSVVELTSSALPSCKLAVFNIYAVNGTENPYRDPESGAIKGTRHDRKLAFHRLLMEECLKLEGEGWNIVMAGDFNVAPDARDGHPKLRTWPEQHCVNRADFLRRFMRVGGKESEKDEEQREEYWQGVDVWREANPERRQYTYYGRTREWGSSCDRVDYVLTSKSLWADGKVIASDILNTEAERGPSDHVPVFVAISIDSTSTD